MMPNPKPDEIITFLNRDGSIVNTDPSRPESPYLLEVQ